MNQHPNIFAFESELVLHVFIAPGTFSESAFLDFADEASKKYMPKRVLIMVGASQLDQTVRSAATDSIKERFKISPKWLSYKKNGSFPTSPIIAKKFLQTAIERIIQDRKPILPAPPGKVFTKPSGKKETTFVQASRLFVNHSEMSVLALRLVQLWGDSLNEKITTVYVDTIDLYGLTSLALEMRFQGKSSKPITVSFSSYEGYKTVLDKVNPNKSLLVISATTSHGLLAKLFKKGVWVYPEKCVTVLSTKDVKGRLKHPIIAVTSTSSTSDNEVGLSPIRIAGERFQMEIDQAKSVVFKKVNHGACLDHTLLEKLAEIRHIFSLSGRKNSETFPLHISSKGLLSSSIFKDWLTRNIGKQTPMNTSHVIWVSGGASCPKWVRRELPSNIKILKPNQLTKGRENITGSIVVICPIFSNGIELKEVSRDLRKGFDPKLQKIVYITGIGTPSSRTSLNRLHKDLGQGGRPIHSFANLCIGARDVLNHAMEAEARILRSINDFSSIPVLEDRKNAILAGSLNDDHAYWQRNKLHFDSGFVFWQGRADDLKNCGDSLMLFITWAIVLQNARISQTLGAEDQLAALQNRRVLIHPENFFRFNDTLIQVTLLLLAKPSELDYRDDESLSESIVYLFDRAISGKDEAVLYPFLIAIISRRLRITANAYEQIQTLVGTSDVPICALLKESLT